MSSHKFSGSSAIIEFARTHTDIIGPDDTIQVDEIGDGNINFVYRVSDSHGNSAIVKQALPYIRIIGEGWPLTLERIRIEAETLQIEAQFAPAYVPQLYYFDQNLFAIAMEDIGDHENLRHSLIHRKALPKLAEHLAEFLAQTLFHTCELALTPEAFNKQQNRFLNSELCGITEEVFFLDPYCDHERNNINPLLKSDAAHMWQDDELKSQVAELRFRFRNHPEALIHGDLHSGSVFVTADSSKIIDPEFAFYGPMGFDIGCIIGNLLLNYCAQSALDGKPDERKNYQDCLHHTVINLWNNFAENFTCLMQDKTLDSSNHSEGIQTKRLENILSDSLGFAGTEMIRRTIGISHVADLESIKNDADRAKAEKMALNIGQALIKQCRQIQSTEQLTALLNSILHTR